MAPVFRLRRRGITIDELRDQWTQPKDVFTFLLIVGGDIIQRALAQLSGNWITPVAFSFGWVAYALSAVLSAVGDDQLMPDPEIQVRLINIQSGFSRSNQSYIISRIIKDFKGWMPERVKGDVAAVIRALQVKRPNTHVSRAPLCVSVFQWKTDPKYEPGVPKYDWVWWLGVIVIPIQLGIAAIPWGLEGDWGVFLITACGTVLALVTGSLPQWGEEKWTCRKKSEKIVAISEGNGSEHVLIIKGDKIGLDLEDLASGTRPSLYSTRIWTCFLAVFWIGLLISSTGFEQHTWYLLAVGGLGMLQNIIVAGLPRNPGAFGLHLDFLHVFVETKVMYTLMDLEKEYEDFGSSLLSEFFPASNKLFAWEKDWWNTKDESTRRTLEDKHRPKKTTIETVYEPKIGLESEGVIR